MSKELLVSAAKEALAVAQDAVLGNLVDAAQSEVPQGGGFSQEQVDAKVSEALAAQKAQNEADFAADEAEDEAKLAEANAHLAEVTGLLSDVSAAKAVSDEKLAKSKAAIDALKAYLEG